MTTTERILPALMAVVYGAALIATWGFTSLLLDVDVIIEKDAGPLLGPAMAGAAILVTWVWLVRVRMGARPVWASVLATASLAAASVWFVMVAVGATGYALTKGQPAWVLLFAGRYSPSAFVLLPAALAGLTIAVSALLTGRSPGAKTFDRR